MIVKVCGFCKKSFQARSNRDQYCDRTCAGLGRRKNRTNKEKKAIKKEYDKQYRKNNQELIKKKKAAYHQKTYSQEAAKEMRGTPKYQKYRKGYLKDYMTPEKVKEKAEYDQERRAKLHYGEYWETSLALVQLQKVTRSKISPYESRKERGLLNKTTVRSRNEHVKRSYT